MSDKPQDTVNINIDGQDVRVPKGMNIIQAASKIGKEVPHYCYHPKLSVSGNCRMCLVEMGMPMKDRVTGEAILDEEGKPKIGWMPKPAIGCGTSAAEGMHIRTNSKLVKDCQEGVMEMLLVNHPLDCPICDQAGECRLQEFATDYGKGYSRFIEKKNVKPKRTVLGPRVTLDDERCILCSRCIRFCQEVVKDDVLGFVDRGSYSTLTCYPGKALENNYSLNTVDICPVGALTSTDFRFKMRVWFLKRTKSISTESSVGVNTEVASREGKIYRITPRRNDEVNDTWMSDSGRMLYKEVESETRIKEYRCRGSKVTAMEAQLRFAEVLPTGKVAYVGSSFMSLEEQFLLKELTKVHNGPVCWAQHVEEGDGLLISSDRTPNYRGALILGLIQEGPTLGEMIDRGDVDHLVVFHEDLTLIGITEEQLKKVKLIYLGTQENLTSSLAYLVFPLLTVFEKSGSFVNQQFRVQKFHEAVPGPSGIVADLLVLNQLIGVLTGGELGLTSPELVWERMAEQVGILKGISFKGIHDTGLLLDKSAFDHIDFPEGETLKYKPGKKIGGVV